jgi:hypothetical protein
MYIGRQARISLIPLIFELYRDDRAFQLAFDQQTGSFR